MSKVTQGDRRKGVKDPAEKTSAVSQVVLFGNTTCEGGHDEGQLGSSGASPGY